MKNKKRLKFNIKALFKAKERLHKELAKISFEEKIAIVFQLQDIAKGFKPVRT